jgi:hypothetical protein
MKRARRELLSSGAGLVLAALLYRPAKPQLFKAIRNTKVTLNLVQRGAVAGSISANSNQLVLSANAGFQVNDHIIVEVGGEAGVGARGTFGVGGVYPTLNYVNLAAMQADTSQPNGTWAYCDDTLECLQWLTANSRWNYDSTQYYRNTIAPRSLNAQVTAVSTDGLTLTLNINASTTATGANVYLDNNTILSALVTAHSGMRNLQVNIPAGKFAFSLPIEFSQQNYWVITGAGIDITTIFTPQGAQCAQFELFQCNNCVVEKLTVQGNAANNGYQQIWDGTGTISYYPVAMLLTSCSFSSIQNCKAVNGFLACIAARTSHNCWADNCSYVMTHGLQNYTSWMIVWANCTGGGAKNCTGASPILIAGCETFSSTDTLFENISLINGTYSANGANNFTFQNCAAILQVGSYVNENSFSIYNPVFNINSNIGPSGGGSIINPTIDQQGYVDATNQNSLINIAINVGSDNVSIIGTYSACNGVGIIIIPNYASLNGFSFGGIGVRNDATGIVVSGIRFVGECDYAANHGNIFAEGGSLTATNNVMDHAVTAGSGTFTETGTESNATWEAACP